MVTAVRRGASVRTVAREFRVSRCTVQRWLDRAKGQRLDRVDFGSRRRGPCRAVNRTSPSVEARVVSIRRRLERSSALGDCGAAAIHQTLEEQHARRIPSVRTIGRILVRQGVLDGRRRQRFPAPPRGWYLPDLAQGRAELDAVDIIEDLVIEGGHGVDVLNVFSLFGHLPGSWPMAEMTAKTVANRLIGHWREVGLPTFAQFDNDTRFQGPHQFPDAVGRVSRLCLQLGVTPVFTPPRETGFQAIIENFNGRWRRKVWGRFHHRSVAQLEHRSDRFVAALRTKNAIHIGSAPLRTPVPDGWSLDLQVPLRGRIIFLRRTTERGGVELLGHHFHVERDWPHRLVRCEVDLTQETIRFFGLRRQKPNDQRLLREVEHAIPHKDFHE